MPEPPLSTTDKLKVKVVDSATATDQLLEEAAKAPAPEAILKTAAPASEASPNAAAPVPDRSPKTPAPVPERSPKTPAPVPERSPKTPSPAPERSPKTPAPAPTRKRHPEALKTILADPTATEEEWLAAAHEVELHGGIKKFEYGPLVHRARRRKRVLVIFTAALAAGAGLVIAFKQPAPVTPIGVSDLPTPVGAPAVQVDFGPYMANLQRNIKREWYPPKRSESRRVMVAFKIYKDGRMDDLKILNHGPDEASDRAALLAVERAAPSFEALPEGAPEDVKIEFKFDYNVTN